jgi:2-oxoglutarate dehydrogenase E2 component (dihydrolipoamide succinyltransferase)
MTIELRVPEVGESISEVTLGEWLKQVGEIVERDEPVLIIETDKVTVELLAPARGRLSQVLLVKGAPAKVRDLVGVLDEVAVEDIASVWPPVVVDQAQAKPVAAMPPYRDAMPTENALPSSREPSIEEVTATVLDAPEARGGWASPSARRARAEREAKGIEESDNPKLLSDRQRVVESGSKSAATSAATGPAAASGREEEIIPMSPFRRTIAERLVHSQNTAALLTTFNEVDLSGVQELRHRYQELFQKRHEVKLGLMSFFVKAVVEALKQLPVLNAEVRGTDIVYRNYFDIGIAVGSGRGLVVPVVRNAEHLSFAEIESTIADFGKRAKENKIQLDELIGGTFTISNGGVYGSLLSTPIVNPPQSGILGLHAIQDRPVAVEGQVVIRPMMYVALTYDHRIVDGREAVTFLRLAKEFVEQPARMLLEV